MNSEEIIWTGPAIEELNRSLQQMNEDAEFLTVNEEAELAAPADSRNISDYGLVKLSTSSTYDQYLSKTSPAIAPVSQVNLVSTNSVSSSSMTTISDTSLSTAQAGVTQTSTTDPSNPTSISQFKLATPSNIRILNELTTKKIDSSGNLYVYITIEFDDVLGATDYDVRLARV